MRVARRPPPPPRRWHHAPSVAILEAARSPPISFGINLPSSAKSAVAGDSLLHFRSARSLLERCINKRALVNGGRSTYVQRGTRTVLGTQVCRRMPYNTPSVAGGRGTQRGAVAQIDEYVRASHCEARAHCADYVNEDAVDANTSCGKVKRVKPL